ncbi:MAG: hypothetical protein KKE51_19790 [Gammaproteobacteria bacterium]|nr:hypothetical protein [Gammaproteobacteria bacterium]MBU1601229.1 hypothetical protein [Gammaproteobacteria bacterium]MBU2433811.1 hypothetical protein [Gammaproteobacteria bacterium]MBU2450672.1 hypothetical protein [Gammaproteobacteria bacterium]
MASGKIFFLLVVATLLALVGAWVVARSYRRSMQRLMKAPVAEPGDGSLPASPPAVAGPTRFPSLADNDDAYRRLLVSFIGLTLVIALSRTVLTQLIADGPITLKTVATLGAAYAWPVLPVLAVIGRWSRPRFVGAMLGWLVLAIALLSWRTNENVSFAQIVGWMLFDTGLPLIVVTALCLGGATRAVGAWLAPLFIVFSASSQLGLDLLAAMIEAESPFIAWLAGWLGATTAFTLFAVLPWLIAWWPARALGRWLAESYRERRISELFYLFTAVWTIALIGPALGAIGDLGWGAMVCFAPLLWIPLGAALMQGFAGPADTGRPPTLLVLRVFQQDANVQAIFDRVIERWRLSGNTVLIAGTDLADRTIDADDIFTFIDGRLGERFINRVADIEPRLRQFELEPDVEGRYRVNECYCHDNTWQQALDRLVGISDVVLMDLRNFKAKNAGCVHELGVLARAGNLARVVILSNPQTERGAALAATAGAPEGRFVWLEEKDEAALKPAEVLAALFPAPSPRPLRAELPD